MKAVLAALAVTLGVLAVALPASAGYTAPGASWQERAFTVGKD